jgi:hypothetical protein
MAVATLDDLRWLTEWLSRVAGDVQNEQQVRRLVEWTEQAIYVREAQQSRSRTRHHRDLMDAYNAAMEQWKLACENATNGFADEVEEFKRDHPMPTLKAFLAGSRRPTDVCPLCGHVLAGDEVMA